MSHWTSRLAPVALLGALGCLAAGHADADEREKETAVFVAVFQQQVREHLDATEKARRTVVCLAIDPGGAPQSPSRDLMARMASEPSVRKAAECDARPEGAVEATTRRPAVIVTAGPIEWVADDEAWATVVLLPQREPVGPAALPRRAGARGVGVAGTDPARRAGGR